MVAIAVLVRYALTPLLGPLGYQYLTVFPAIIVVAIFAGRWPAVVTSVLSSLLGTYLFSHVLTVSTFSGIVIVIMTGFLIGWLDDKLRIALDQSQERSRALAESEERFRTMANSIPQLAWIARGDGYIEWYNQRWYEYTGKTPQEMEGWGWQSVHDPHVLPGVLEKWKSSIATGQPFSMEFPLRGADGVFRPFLTQGMPLKDTRGRIVQWFGTNTDLSERRQAEDALRESEQRFESFMQHLPGAAFIKDLDGKYVYANPELDRIFARRLEDILGKTDADLLPPETATHFQENDRRALKEGSTETVERLHQPDGLEHHSIVSKFIVPGPDAKPAYLGGVAFDITERKKAEDALRESEQRIRQHAAIDEAIMANMGEGLYTLDSEGLVTYVNPAAEHILGFSSAELIGRKMHDLIHWRHPSGAPFPAEDCPSTQVLYHGKTIVSQEDVFIRKNNQFVPVIYSSACILVNGKRNGLVVVFRDITVSKRTEDALRESEERFRMLADNISQLAWMADEKGSFFWLNKRACEYTGGGLKTLQGSGWQTLLHPSQLEHLIKKSNECVRTGTYFEDTVLVRGKAGNYRWFLCRSIPIHGEKESVIRWFGTATDIHELKQTQQALEESEQKFRMLAENAGAIIGIMQDNKIIYANPFAEVASGYTRQELYDIDIPKLIHPAYQKKMMERAQKRQAGEPIESHYEFIMVRKDGEHRWLDFSPIRISYRGKPAIIGMAFDVTKRKNAEEALRESEETFRLLAQHAKAVIGIVQGERFVYANPYLETLSGYTREEILQMPIGQMIHPESRAQVLERARRRQAGEPVETHYEFSMLTKSGGKIWLDFSVTAIHYHGQPAIVGIAIDITDRKSIERDLLKYKDQLEDKNKELESIIGIVSHDLRAPLVNIEGFNQEVVADCKKVDALLAKLSFEQTVEKQLDKLLHHDIPESVQYIQSSTQAMNNLVRTLLETARAGVLPLKPENLNMNVLIKEILASIEMRAKKAGVAYGIGTMPNCYADGKQVEQIFRNLLDNAIKYLAPDRPGQICIGGTLQANSALYWVADNGIGIPPEHQEKIFEPYWQLKEKASGGIGMGLVTVKRMVEHNAGQIWVVSEKGKYTTFYVAIPASKADKSTMVADKASKLNA